MRIRDTGVGMTRSELEQAMKPFRQVSTNSRKRGDGTGLGLPLTKAMVDANRATFSINSAPNEGTLVEITFPRRGCWRTETISARDQNQRSRTHRPSEGRSSNVSSPSK